MEIKKLVLTSALLGVSLFVCAQNESEIIVLDLSKSTTPLTFDTTNGMWEGTYDDDETEIESQVFSFVHNSMSDYNTWWGFTASNSVDNKRQDNTLTYQFSNMGLGGIVLNEDGTIKTNSFGAPETSGEMPYLVAFAMTGFSKHPADMTFIDGESYEAVGAYFNLNSYTYYCIEYGDSFARAFNNGDKFTLTVHGIADDDTEKTVDVELAAYNNGNLTINRGWTYVDLSELGVVNQIWFSMNSTDSGAYGMNTPAYFCMDKLMVRPAGNNAVNSVTTVKNNIRYDRASQMVYLHDTDFAMIYDAAGRCVMTSSDTDFFSVKHLPAGIYIVKAGNNKLKIAR
ncbi:MAG: DUF4465 domain-containing protein [Muribaculaceae bacterium]|nr:DUF4465 domain-containing protein [Muribaculaceae bacterium]